MDEIFKLYNQLILADNRYSEYSGDDKYLLNINYFKNQMKEEIDGFMGHFVKAFKILQPKLNAMVHLVYIKEVGGHIEMKEPGYQTKWIEYQNEIDHIIRHYNHIRNIQNDICEELRLQELRQSRKLSDSFSLTQIFNTPEKHVTANQLSLF